MGNAAPLHRNRQGLESGPSDPSKRTKRNERLAALSFVVSAIVLVWLLAKGVESTFDKVLLAVAIVYFAVEMFNYLRLRGQRERANR